MRKIKCKRIGQIIVSAILCMGLLLVQGDSPRVMAAQMNGGVNTSQEQLYTINYQDAVKVGDTYWFTFDKTVRIEAAENYRVSTTGDLFYSDLTFEHSTSPLYPLPSQIYLENTVSSSEIIGPIQLNLAWDSARPQATITLGSVSVKPWNYLDSPIVYEIASMDNAFYINATDEGESGVQSIQYYISDEDLVGEHNNYQSSSEKIEQQVGDGWINGASGTLTQLGPNIIYTKITDYVGNTSYMNSTGIILYAQPSVSTTSIAYTKEGDTDPTFEIELNGNMFDGDLILQDASGNRIADFTQREDETDTSWGYHNADGLITLNREFLDSLDVEGTETTYTLTINYISLQEQYPDIQDSSITIGPNIINVTISKPPVDISHWGTEVPRSDNVVQYVDDTGKSSVEIASSNLKNGVLWLSEEANATKNWYGIDVSKDEFSVDQTDRFYVQWLGSTEADYIQLDNQIDETVKKQMDDTNKWIFRMGVENVDKEKVQPSGPVKVYIQIDDSWDKENIKVYAIGSGIDESIPVKYVENMDYSDGVGNFAELSINHFSPYVIYEEKETTNEPPTDEPPTNEPPTDEPPTNEPPTDEPPTGEEPPTNDEPPTVTSPKTGDTYLGLEMCLAMSGVLLLYWKKIYA